MSAFVGKPIIFHYPFSIVHFSRKAPPVHSIKRSFMSTSNKRKRAAKRRRARKLTLYVTAIVLALALCAIVVWVALDRASQRAYPMDYAPMVRSVSAEYALSPAYVAAVILAESGYDPQAVSSANAQGMMQLLPSTAEWIAPKLSETYTDGCLFDPQTNMRYGCWYLAFLMRRYGDDMRCASSAYHAGQGTVDKWLQNPEYSRDGRTLDVIPYKSTNTYVQRVLKYYEKYSKLYADA